MADLVHQTLDGQVAILEIDNPPVNATSQGVRQALLDAIMRAEGDPAIGAIVIAGAGRTFVAGGDISEFGKAPREPHLPDVINKIEESSKPIVVAWHGTALGGGCEIGLAAHKRIIARTGQVGLPEVKLGLIPGAGGTQRLPRLIGLSAALDLVASGRLVGAEEAVAIGLADAVAEGDVRLTAIEVARKLIGHMQQRVSLKPVPPADPGAWEAMVARVKREARGRIAPFRAIDLISQTVTTPFTSGVLMERSAFLELMASDQSRALRHLFFAEREILKVPGLEGIAPRAVEHIGVIGAGTMGSGIAVAFLDAGFHVTLIESTETAMQAGMDRIAALYGRALKSGRITENVKTERLARLTPATELSALASVDLVIEAVFEDMAVKLALLARIEAIVQPDALIATNTSYLDIEMMADSLAKPERFLGLHFFSPANIMKLLEIVRPRRASLLTIATGVAVGKRLKKIAVVCGVCEGFIGNRILAKFRAQCEFMLEEGALPQEVDAAMEGFGLAMGPFAVQDLAGLDIAWARRKRLAASRNPADRDVPIVDRLCEQGRFGQKTGRGWYIYRDGKREIDPETDALVRDHAQATGRLQRHFSAAEIQARVLSAMVNEGAKIVAEGIAARPLDVDVVLVNGYGFPSWRGGPMQEADTRGLSVILSTVHDTAARDGHGFEVSTLLEELVRDGRNFSTLNT